MVLKYGYKESLKILIPALKESKKFALLVLSSVLALIGIAVALNYWRGAFYNYLQVYDIPHVFLYLGIFTALASVAVVIEGLGNYWTRFLEFQIRESLYNKYKELWKLKQEASNPEQRLAEDCIQFAQISISFCKTLINALVKLPVFLFILLSIANVWMVLVALAYAILGTVFSKIVAKPLVKLEFLQQQKEAEFRRTLTFEVQECRPVLPNLNDIKENWKELAKKNKMLTFFISGYGQIGIILPFVMLLPMYTAKKIALGTLFQAAQGMDNILESLSVLVGSRDIIVNMQMITKRLKELE